jgi:hypothetical protein
MFWPANDKETLIAKGAKLQLGYRVIVFSGTAETAGIAAAFQQYSASPLVAIP